MFHSKLFFGRKVWTVEIIHVINKYKRFISTINIVYTTIIYYYLHLQNFPSF